MSLVVKGRSAHVSQRSQGVNAIDKLVQLLPRINERALSYSPHPDFPFLPTVNIGVVRAGTLPSMLADRAEAGIDVRTVPGMTPETVLADFRRVIGEVRADDPDLNAELLLSSRPRFCQERPFHMNPEAPVVRTVATAHQKVAGTAARVGTLVPQVFFGTDASHILAAGIRPAIYGPGQVTDINTPDESISFTDIITAANVYLSSILMLAASRQPS